MPDRLLITELTLAADLAKLSLRLRPLVASSPRGGGAPVLVLPGYGLGDDATWPLRRFLCAIGYRAEGWGVGRNDGRVTRLAGLVQRRAEALAASAGRPVRLVGWSLGGAVAREVARASPGAIAQLVTLGTPVIGGASRTAFALPYRLRGIDLDAVALQMERREASRPVPAPMTTIYSRRDGVVSWRACLDPYNPSARAVEVRSSHAGLIANPEVYAAVAEALAPGDGGSTPPP